MGVDFSAVFSYPGPGSSEHRILELERATPPAVKCVLETWLAEDFGYDPEFDRVRWADTYDVSKEVPRPELPSTKASLGLAECFYLTFGRDAVWVYHTLRWRIFLTEPRWQTVMLEACTALGRHVGASEYVVTWDESPVVVTFLAGASYQEAIDRALADGEPEVEKLTDMYIDVDEETWDTKGFYQVRLDAG